MEIDIDLMISLVHERPELWDRSSEVYKDKNKSREGWKCVCSPLPALSFNRMHPHSPVSFLFLFSMSKNAEHSKASTSCIVHVHLTTEQIHTSFLSSPAGFPIVLPSCTLVVCHASKISPAHGTIV